MAPEPQSLVQPLVYTVDEAARALTVCPRTIRNLVRCGELVGRKIGSRLVIPRASAENFLRRDHPTGKDRAARRKAKRGRRPSAAPPTVRSERPSRSL
jgi:excisionase family DNA binding protein